MKCGKLHKISKSAFGTPRQTRGVYRTANKAPKTLLRRIFAGNLEDVKTSPFAGMCTEVAMRADRAS